MNKNNSQQFLKDVVVKSSTGSDIVLQDLWKNQTVIIKVFRRFGCPICRYEAYLLSQEKARFDSLGVKVIGIGFESTGLQEFIDGNYWAWDIYLDSDNKLNENLKLNRLTPFNVLYDVFSTQTKAAVTEAISLNIYGDFYGDLFRLGATFVLGPTNKGRGLIYEYYQTSSSKFTSIKELFKACGGNPNLVKELAPAQCLQYQSLFTGKKLEEVDCFVPECMETVAVL